MTTYTAVPCPVPGCNQRLGVKCREGSRTVDCLCKRRRLTVATRDGELSVTEKTEEQGSEL